MTSPPSRLYHSVPEGTSLVTPDDRFDNRETPWSAARYQQIIERVRPFEDPPLKVFESTSRVVELDDEPGLLEVCTTYTYPMPPPTDQPDYELRLVIQTRGKQTEPYGVQLLLTLDDLTIDLLFRYPEEDDGPPGVYRFGTMPYPDNVSREVTNLLNRLLVQLTVDRLDPDGPTVQ